MPDTSQTSRLGVALIMTAVPVEMAEVRKFLVDLRVERDETGRMYEVGTFVGHNTNWTVVLRQSGQGNVNAALETERAIRRYQPQVAMFVGVAGGFKPKDVTLGDVVVGSQVYGYETTKEADLSQPRTRVFASTRRILEDAKYHAAGPSWLDLLKAPQDDEPHVVVGPILSGEKILANAENQLFRSLKQNYGEALAVEMEGLGFLTALDQTGIECIVLRGISDMVDGKDEADAQGSQPVAARRAAAFGFNILSHWDASTLPAAPARTIGEWSVRVEGSIQDTTTADIERLFEQIQELAADQDLRLVSTRIGSVVLVISGAYTSYLRFQRLWQSGHLKKLGERTILSVAWADHVQDESDRPLPGSMIVSFVPADHEVRARESFGDWRRRALDRFQEITQESGLSALYAHGIWVASYRLERGSPASSLRAFLSALGRAEGRDTGWPTWWVPTKSEIAPYPHGNVIECWLGPTNSQSPGTADFWWADPSGQLLLVRGHQEDGPDVRLSPGTVFELSLPVWRTGEALRHAARLSSILGIASDSPIEVHFEWRGLKDRTLTSLFNPSRIISPRRSRDAIIEVNFKTTREEIEGDLWRVVKRATQRLYMSFEFLEPVDSMYTSELSKMINRT